MANVVNSRVEPVVNAVNNVVEMIKKGNNDEPEKVEVETNVEFIGAYKSIDENIIQETDTWCGMASTLMVLTALETSEPDSLKDDYVRPTQSEIADRVRDWKDTGNVELMTKYLNSQLKPDAVQYRDGELAGDRWEANMVTHYIDKEEVKRRLIRSLELNRPVILNCNPYDGLNYYSDYPDSGSHYVVVEAYDKETDTFVICDCTYIDKKYQGRHYGITIEEIHKSLRSQPNPDMDGWLIYAK